MTQPSHAKHNPYKYPLTNEYSSFSVTTRHITTSATESTNTTLTTSTSSSVSSTSTSRTSAPQSESQGQGAGSTKQTRMRAAADAQRHFALSLYKAILNAHRLVLDPIMRDMGDTYVRDEFKRHKDAQPQYLQTFFQQWLTYLSELKRMSDTIMMQHSNADSHDDDGGIRFGRELSAEERESLNEEQRKQLFELETESKKIDQLWDTALDEVERTQRQQQQHTDADAANDVTDDVSFNTSTSASARDIAGDRPSMSISLSDSDTANNRSISSTVYSWDGDKKL